MKLSFKKYGNGKPLVILHGLYGSSDNWVSIGRKLGDNYTVYLVDQRNHGESPHDRVHTFNAMAEDLKTFSEDQGLDSFYLAGHSMGGKTAMMFAAKYPEYVKKLMVLDISPKSHQDNHNKTIFDQHQAILSMLNELDLKQYPSRKEIDRAISKKIASKAIRQFILKNLKRDGQDHFSWKMNVPVLHKQLFDILSDIELEPYQQNLKDIPVLFLNGGNSNYLSEDDKPYLERIFANISFKTLHGTGHWVHAEAPDKVLQHFRSFFD